LTRRFYSGPQSLYIPVMAESYSEIVFPGPFKSFFSHVCYYPAVHISNLPDGFNLLIRCMLVLVTSEALPSHDNYLHSLIELGGSKWYRSCLHCIVRRKWRKQARRGEFFLKHDLKTREAHSLLMGRDLNLNWYATSKLEVRIV
ncbi:hypothetical protein Bca52824_031696, partial [Brassica carinata]